MNIRWTLILSLVAIGLLGWFYHLQEPDTTQLADLIKSDDKPEYTGYKMQTTVYSPTGERQYVAFADKVEYYNNDGHTQFERPLVYLFDVQSSQPELEHQNWKLSANNATLSKNNLLYLDGDVLAQSLQADSRLQRINTERAEVNLKTQDITSDTMATISGLNFTSSGLKLRGNLQQQIATLQEQVKTYYEINK